MLSQAIQRTSCGSSVQYEHRLSRGMLQPTHLRVGRRPAPSSRHSRLAVNMGYTIEKATRRELQEVGSAFVTAFFLGGDESKLPDASRRRLERAATADLDKRYGRQGQRSLFVARDDDGDVAGCAGIEVAAFDGERVLKGLDWPGSEFRPLVANLAIVASARRKGLAKKLMRSCEEAAVQWGFDEIVLVVDSANTPARKLYAKLGYKDEGELQETTVVAVTDSGAVIDEPVDNILMRKSLKPFPVGLYENLDLPTVGVALVAIAALAGVVSSNPNLSLLLG